jgi:hypothetical protein
MPRPLDRLRRVLPSGLTGLAATACAACCAIPILLAAGVLSGAGWAALGRTMPGIAVVLAVLAALTWWWASRRWTRAAGCAGGGCSCSGASSENGEVISARSGE